MGLTKGDELAAQLAGVLRDRRGVEVSVTNMSRLSGGASRETWAFDATFGLPLDAAGGDAADADAGAVGTSTAAAGGSAQTMALVLQRERPGAAAGGNGMQGEAELLAAVALAGVPVASVVATDLGAARSNDELGAPFIVMERVDGETIPRRILRDDELGSARRLLVSQAASALAALHRIDPDELDGLDDTDQIEQFAGLLDVLGEPHPAFELALRWLAQHRCTPRRRSIVHGDFRLGNLIVGPEGLRAVLDWELAHVGDPVEDLGWFCVRAWRFGSPLAAGGLGTAEELLDAYAEAGGDRVSLADLRWWEALGTLKWGVMCVIQASAHLSGASRSVELAAIGRRTAENEEDVLSLLFGPSDYEPTAAAAASKRLGGAPHDRPTSAELLDAVGEYLAQVRDEVPGRLGFHARVAANVVATVRRELELGAVQAVRHDERLAALGISAIGRAGDIELAAAIRAGELDDDLAGVAAVVRESVRDKLAVANPGYWEQRP